MVQPGKVKMNTVNFFIPRISCGHCVRTITNELKELAGVEEVQVSQDTKKVVVRFDAPATKVAIESLLAEINYPAAQ